MLGLWPDEIRDRLTSGFDSLAKLSRYANDVSRHMSSYYWCHRSGRDQQITLGHIHVAGSPCTDFSSMGKQRGFEGPASAAFITWVVLVRRHCAWILVHENVLGFDIKALAELLADLYDY